MDVKQPLAEKMKAAQYLVVLVRAGKLIDLLLMKMPCMFTAEGAAAELLATAGTAAVDALL